MGNCFSNQSKKKNSAFKSHDQIISEFEENSPFSRISLSKIEKAFNENNFEKRLAMPDLRSALAQLDLDPKLLNNPESPFCKFFDALLEEDRLYLQRKLVLSAVLTKNERVEKKLEVITKYYDINEDKVISKEEIETFVDEIIDISVRVVPMMAVKDALEENSILIERGKLEASIYSLEKVRHRFKKRIVKKLLHKEESLTFNEFVLAFEKHKLKYLLNSKYVRNELDKKMMNSVSTNSEVN